MSRSQQDQFIDDDEEETCPLCVEEFDLGDRNFRPCPCGYQICQFCFHNVRTNMNGLCPACRRPYREEDFELKTATPEEQVAYKLRQVQRQKKTQAALQKEKQKAEADNLSRKHLAGLRVVQKNLVYVTGLSPSSQEEQLLQTLRGDQYFGQYGKIIKIVVSKAKDPSYPQSVGVYVTYERKDDAAKCIAAVDGSKNGERTLRAQFGTTKYCSAYLRGETCANRNCMFLHEPGEANESYSRADLSALNAGSSQSGSIKAPPPQSQQPVASAAQPMLPLDGDDQPSSPSGDRPALPSSASWASRPAQPSRADTCSVSTTAQSPMITTATPVAPQPEPTPEEEPQPPAQSPVVEASIPAPVSRQSRKNQIGPLLSVVKALTLNDFKFAWSPTSLSQADLEIIENYPPLFDSNGGARRRLRRQREEEQRRMEQEVQMFDQPPMAEPEEIQEMSGGSLQLGGEPEERHNLGQTHSAIHPPGQEDGLDQNFRFGGGVSSPGISDHGLTPQQHQQKLLQTLKPNTQGGYPANNSNQAAAFSPSHPPQGHPPGHQRNVSRFSFANDSGSASAAVKPVANMKLMNQQSAMMPPTGSNHFGSQHQQPHSQFYTSNVQGPPPGLKTTGTPPVSGNLTFGQGHGFATGGLQYGAGTPRNQQDNYYRELLRGGDGGARGVDAKRELHSFPSYHNSHLSGAYPASQSNAFAASPYASLSAFGESEKQRKKKGKKHRHANTSSSSGVGVVDVADPSTNHLLQARMHQGGGSFGGGAFSGQAGSAPDDDFPPLRPSARQLSITSRASLEESRRSTPPVPPGFEGQTARESRRATPTVPPGLSRPTALPDLEGGASRPTSRPSSRTSMRRNVSQIMPAVPLRPATPARPSSPIRKETKEEVTVVVHETPTRQSRATTSSDLRIATSAAEVEAPATSSSLQVKSGKEKVSEPPAVDAGKSVPGKAQPKNPTSLMKEAASVKPATQPGSKGPSTGEASDTKAASITPSKLEPGLTETQKRKHPGKLDIAAAVSKAEPVSTAMSTSTPVDTSTPSRSSRVAAVQTPSSSSKLPESPNVNSASSMVKTAPRTLRVVQTPKAETPPPAPFATPGLPSAAAHKLPSRKPSVTSLNLPGTPSSEQISMSDNISLTSTSLSRANSPPPVASSKVGSAPVRTKTKSQMKKERQERAKAIEEERVVSEETSKAEAEETAQEAIISRKKKEKKAKEIKPKPKASPATSESTPDVSRPVSPRVKPAVEAAPKPEVIKPAVIETKAATPTKAQATPVLPSHVQSEPSPPPTPTLTAAKLLADLKSSAPQLNQVQKCLDSLFRVPGSAHFKPSQPITAKDLANQSNWRSDFKFNLSKEDVDALLKGKAPAIQYGGEDGRVWDRGMVTPSGAHLRALTHELEARFLELEKALREMPEEFQFRPSKPQNEVKLPAFDLEALKRQFENANGRGVSVMEQMVQDGSTKKGAFLVDEASRYINEFVMPPATPPPSVGPSARGQAAGGALSASGAHFFSGEPAALSVDVVERQLHDARKTVDEKENALKKVMKKNKKLLGLS